MVRGLPVTEKLSAMRFAPQAASRARLQGGASAATERRTPRACAPVTCSSARHTWTRASRYAIRYAKEFRSRILKRASHITVVVEPKSEKGA